MAGGGANVTHTHTSINTHAHVHTAHTLSHFTPVCVDMETKTHLKTVYTQIHRNRHKRISITFRDISRLTLISRQLTLTISIHTTESYFNLKPCLHP